MASPPPGVGQEPNLEPFSTLDPFHSADGSAHEHEAQSTPQEADGESSTSTRDRPESSDDIKRSGSAKALTESESHGDNLLDKIKTATNEVEHGVVEKLKTITHKLHFDRLDNMTATGVTKLLNPTAVHMNVRFKGDDDESIERQVLWRARDNRKGRNSVVVPLAPSRSYERFAQRHQLGRRSKQVAKNILQMFITFPYWDMAFWSGWSYTVGSALFVIDGAFAWGPLAFPSTEFPGEEKYGVPLCFFFGAIFYQIGAVMAYLEAINDGSFHGSAMRRLLDGHEADQKQMLDEKLHSFFGQFVPHHHHKRQDEERAAHPANHEGGWVSRNRRMTRPSLYPSEKPAVPRRGGVDLGAEEGQESTYSEWRWYPSWKAMKEHHVYEIGFLACAIQLFGVTLYGVTGIVVLPGILDSLSQWQENAAYWIPQMVAAACFLIASIMFLLETQEKWWKPEPKVLGWWIGFWCIVGSVGFELCAGFGPSSGFFTWAEYQSSLSSMWGSAGYLIGSFLQWYEAINKLPFTELLEEPGEMKSWQIHI